MESVIMVLPQVWHVLTNFSLIDPVICKPLEFLSKRASYKCCQDEVGDEFTTKPAGCVDQSLKDSLNNVFAWKSFMAYM